MKLYECEPNTEPLIEDCIEYTKDHVELAEKMLTRHASKEGKHYYINFKGYSEEDYIKMGKHFRFVLEYYKRQLNELTRNL